LRSRITRSRVRLVTVVWFFALAMTMGLARSEPSALAAGLNLVRDPGFEMVEADSPWSGNNWAKNEANFIRDEATARSGRSSQQVVVSRIIHAPNVQFWQPKVAVRPGMSVRLSFWLRGRSNTQPIVVQLRKQAMPYTAYFEASVAPSDDWAESVLTFTLPSSTDEHDTALIFTVKEEQTIWIDDVTLSELPPVDPSGPVKGNAVANASFEVGTDRWYATFRESGGYANASAAEEANISADLSTVELPDCPDGRRAMTFPVFEKCSVEVTSAYFPLSYGHETEVAFWLNSSAPGRRFHASVGQGKFPNALFDGKEFVTVGPGWHQYTFRATPRPSPSGTYFFRLKTQSPGSYSLDAVSVIQAPDPSGDTQPVDVALNPVNGAPVGNIYHPNDDVIFQVVVSSPTGTLPLRGRVVDAWDRTVHEFSVDVIVPGEEIGRAQVTLPSNRQGGFKVQLLSRTPESEKIVAEALYNVTPRLVPAREAPVDSFFGGHAKFTPYNLHIAEKAGFRWLRTHPPLDTKWTVVESRAGEWSFDTRGVARARDAGFRLLGSLDTVPAFRADADAADLSKSTVWSSFPPADPAAWKAYVTNTVAVFSPWIDHWEIWNEPDGNFLQVRKGQSKPLVYRNILRWTREAIDKMGAEVTLIGLAVASVDRTFAKEVLALGGADDVDVLSFHLYDEELSPDERRPPLEPYLTEYGANTNRSGETPKLWHTEGGVWLSNGHSWLQTPGIPPTSPSTMRGACSVLVRTVASLKALGVARHFHYADFAHPAGRIVYRDETSGLIAVTGEPHAALTAHAVAVHFLERATPDGLHRISAPDNRIVTVARFKANAKTLSVVWSRKPIRLLDMPSMNPDTIQVFDMMGNPIEAANALVDESPLYVFEN